MKVEKPFPDNGMVHPHCGGTIEHGKAFEDAIFQKLTNFLLRLNTRSLNLSDRYEIIYNNLSFDVSQNLTI